MDFVDVLELGRPVSDARGIVYDARVIGGVRDDGMWDGRIEFRGDDGSVLMTGSETTQPNAGALVTWATGRPAEGGRPSSRPGITPAYLEGALARAKADRGALFDVAAAHPG